MPLYEATVNYKGFHVIRLEAEDKTCAGDRAAEIFDELSKGNLEMDNIEITNIDVNKPDPADKWDTDERV